MQQIVTDIARELGITPESPGVYHRQIETLLSINRQCCEESLTTRLRTFSRLLQVIGEELRIESSYDPVSLCQLAERATCVSDDLRDLFGEMKREVVVPSDVRHRVDTLLVEFDEEVVRRLNRIVAGCPPEGQERSEILYVASLIQDIANKFSNLPSKRTRVEDYIEDFRGSLRERDAIRCCSLSRDIRCEVVSQLLAGTVTRETFKEAVELLQDAVVQLATSDEEDKGRVYATNIQMRAMHLRTLYAQAFAEEVGEQEQRFYELAAKSHRLDDGLGRAFDRATNTLGRPPPSEGE